MTNDINTLPSIQEAWVDSGLGNWDRINLNCYGKINIQNNFCFNLNLSNEFKPPLVNNINILKSLNYIFSYCSGLKTLDLSFFDTSNVTIMDLMFGWCSDLTSLDLSSWDVGNVIKMHNMFYKCLSLKEIKCTQATKEKILSFRKNGLPTNFKGWKII